MSNEFATSGGHWYAEDGSPAYTQPNKSKPGETRPTTIRDARKLNLVPSVTGIIKMAAKPALERWKLEQLMLSALTMPAVAGESMREYEARLWKDSNAQAEAARDRGTEIHGYIESFYETGKTFYDGDNVYVRAVYHELNRAFGGQEWKAEKSFSSPLGFGGKIDLYSEHVIIDYKTKENNKITDKPMTYLENKMQLSAYRKGLNLPNAKIANVYIGRDLEDGEAKVKIEIHKDDRWAEFECLLNYWKLVKSAS